MKSILAILAAVLLSATAPRAQTDVLPPEERALITQSDNLDEFLWIARPVVIFADTPNDPRFLEQMDLLESRKQELFDRDVVVLVDTDPAAASPMRKNLRPNGFGLVLIGKDGQIAMRKPTPWNVRELTRQIDKLPLRKQEIQDAKKRPPS